MIKAIQGSSSMKLIRSVLDYSPSDKPRFFRRFIYSDSTLYDHDGLSKHMFREDISRAALQLSTGRSGADNISVEIIGDDAEVEKVKSLLGGDSDTHGYRYSRDDFEGNLYRLAEEVIQSLSWIGSVRYEIMKSPEGYKLQNITSSGFYYFGIFYVHIAPKKDAENYGRRYGFGLKRHVWRVDIPKVFGGKWGYKSLLKNLKRFSSSGPGFFRFEMGGGKFERSFDCSLYRKKVKAFEWRKTTDWGWDHRDSSLDDCTEFYLFNRKVRFNRSLAILREHILNEINILLVRLDIDAKIEVRGLPSSQEIDNILLRMSKGELSLVDAHNGSAGW